MIKTECSRDLIDNHSDYPIPADVQERLDLWNKTNPIKLELFFDADDTKKWQFYRLKHKAATDREDTMHWQMSTPNFGTGITPGVFDWLKQYDTSQGGYLDRDELTKQWLKTWKQAEYDLKERKKRDQLNNSPKETKSLYLDHNKLVLSKQIAVPITVGYGANGPIRAVPKGTAKAMKESKKKVRAANG